ncbi:MAG: hypothetical protein IKY59_02330 [Oscillospiraceae bacterium]|nr:hypothetical protein [Oscillospiraceae bacterium]
MNVLKEFWYGNINPQEQSKDNNLALKELLNLMGRNRDQLQATMTPEQQVILEKYDDCVNEMYGLIETEVFSYGFRLGGRLMLATLLDEGTLGPSA